MRKDPAGPEVAFDEQAGRTARRPNPESPCVCVRRLFQAGICDSVRSRSLLSVALMKRQIGHRSRSFARGLRGRLTVLLTVAYVVVGFTGEISCASETLASADQIEASDIPVKTDPGSKKPVTVVDHCYTCVPLLIPPPVLVAEPAAKAVSLAYATPTIR